MQFTSLWEIIRHLLMSDKKPDALFLFGSAKLIHIITIAVRNSCQIPEYNDDGIRPVDANIAYFSVFGLATHYVADVWFLQLVVERLVAFQAAYGEPLPGICVIVWLSRFMIFMVTMQAFGVVSRVMALGNAITLSVGVVFLFILLFRAYTVPYKYLLKAQKLDVNDALSAQMKIETTFAMHIIRRSQMGFFWGSGGMILAFMAFGLDFFVLPRDQMWSMIYVVASNFGFVGDYCILGDVVRCELQVVSTALKRQLWVWSHWGWWYLLHQRSGRLEVPL